MCLLRNVDATHDASLCPNTAPPRHDILGARCAAWGSVIHPGSDAVSTKPRSKPQAGGAHGEVRYRVKGEAHQLCNGSNESEDEHLELPSGGQASANIQTTISIS